MLKSNIILITHSLDSVKVGLSTTYPVDERAQIRYKIIHTFEGYCLECDKNWGDDIPVEGRRKQC